MNTKDKDALRKHPAMQALMKRLDAVPDFEENEISEDINDWSEAQLDAFLKARDIDGDQAYRKFKRMTTTANVVNPKIQNIRRLVKDTGVFLELTLAGLEHLRTSYTPAYLADDSVRTELEQQMDQDKIYLVLVSLRCQDDSLRIGMRWRDHIPAKPPSLSVSLQGQTQTVDCEWPNWDGEQARTQGVVLNGCVLSEAQKRIINEKSEATVLLNYCWEHSSNHLSLELLPEPPS